MRRETELGQIVRGALLIALGLILPYFFHGIKDAGSIFLPMHIPIIIGAFILKPKYAALVGFLTPVISHLFTGMPPFPFVYVMVCELTAYGFFISILYRKTKIGLYPSLISGMLIGRFINIAASYLVLHMIMSKPFKFNMVMAGLFIKGLPGIIIQLILIPILVIALQKSLKINYAKN